MKKNVLKTIIASLAFIPVAAFGQCPTITCPGNISVNSGAGTCSAVVSYTTPVGADPCATVTQVFNYTGAIATYTVPAGVTSVIIDAKGAQGGFNSSSTLQAGLGAHMRGVFAVTPGSILKVLVGQQPNSTTGNGGGGGSFVTDNSDSPMLVAGGGGGSASTDDSPDKDGQITTGGGNGAGGGGAGGTGGNGGNIGASGFQSGAGGGFLTDGADGFIVSSGGSAFVNGGAGAPANPPANGGYGGGGSGSSYIVGGGGGGYSGGGGGGNTTGGVGGGGGSFNGGTSQVNNTGTNSGNGEVNIIYNTATTTRTAGLASGSSFPLGATTVTYEVDNGAGATNSCSFIVTVHDNQDPVPDDGSLPVAHAQCSLTLTAPTATDNCAGTITATTSDPISYSTQGTHTVTWSYNDGHGNIATQTQTVTIDDTTPPVPTTGTLPNVTGICSATASTPPTASDNCVGSIAGTTTDPLSYSVTGTHVIHWTYNDGHGNTSSQTQNVIITGVDTAVSITGSTLTANAAGATYNWLNCDSHTIVAGATNQSYTVTANGHYALVITEGSCKDTSACYNFANTGISGISELTSINIYPNPTHGTVAIELGSIAEGTVQVSDILGRIVLSKKIKDHTITIDLSSFDDGIFFITVETSSSRKISRLIKN